MPRRPHPLLHLNGKWLAHELSGTERYADEIMSRLVEERGRRLVLHLPSNAPAPTWAAWVEIRRSRWRGQLFEQIALPLKTLGRPLLSLAGPAPLLKRRQLVVLHDASVFALGSTYSWQFRVWYRILYRVLAHHAAIAVTVSRFSARELSKALGVNEEHFHVVPNGADHLQAGLGGTEGSQDSKRYVLLVGGNVPHKNTRWAIAALQPLGVEVVVVGKFRPSRQFVDEGNPDDGARWVGRVSDQELKRYYEGALCLVFPSLYEGFGIPVIEAQAVSCAVVASTNAALPEVGGDGALYFDTNSQQQLRDAVTALRENPRMRAELAQRGRSNLARFSWERSATMIGELADRL